MALNNLGTALAEMRRFEEAISVHQDAAAIFQETANHYLEEIARKNLDSDRVASAAESARE
jgi:hypothetical protein